LSVRCKNTLCKFIAPCRDYRIQSTLRTCLINSRNSYHNGEIKRIHKLNTKSIPYIARRKAFSLPSPRISKTIITIGEAQIHILRREERIGLVSIFLFPTVTAKTNSVTTIIDHIKNIIVLAFICIDNFLTSEKLVHISLLGIISSKWSIFVSSICSKRPNIPKIMLTRYDPSIKRSGNGPSSSSISKTTQCGPTHYS